MNAQNGAPVIIDDDDVVMVDSDDIINVDDKNTSKVPKNATTIDTIVLDEESTPADESNKTKDTTTAQKNSDNANNIEKEKEKSFVMLLKNNTLMNKIVQRCLHMEHNAGMERVINKTLLPLYEEADNTFKESESFSRTLSKIIHNLKHDPDHKFLHMKSLCEQLKEGRYRRKVPFITLTTDVKKKPTKPVQRKTREKSKKKNNKKIVNGINKTDVIDLDNSDDEPVITLNVDDDSDNDIMIVDDATNSDGNSEQSNKENSRTETENIMQLRSKRKGDDNRKETHNQNLETHNQDVEMDDETNETHVESVDIQTQNIETDDNRNDTQNESLETHNGFLETHNSNLETTNDKSSNPDYDLLIPQISVDCERHSREFVKAKEIENQIAFYKNRIEALEEAEVNTYDEASPYILCDKYKAAIVAAYKRLCRLTGNGDGNLLKQRVVRLHVVDGHPSGPVKRLERFLNSTIDETGSVPLPDFHDVVRCVTQSNIADNLCWSKQEIMKEALALFTHCGIALRKQRQKREFKDLLSLVQDKEDDYDPANEDPSLLAKLEENKLIAKANEDEVLKKYVLMEYLPKSSTVLNPRLGDSVKPTVQSDTDSDGDSDLTHQDKVKTTIPPACQNLNERESSKIDNKPDSINSHEANKTSIRDCTMQNIIDSTIQQSMNTTTQHSTNTTIQHSMNTTIQNSVNKKDTPKTYDELNTLQKIGVSNRYVMAINSDTPSVDHDSMVAENKVDSTEEKESVPVKLEPPIKSEPVDIQRLLDELGDNYKLTVFDIEDPFVVIDISSDSSDDEL